MTHTPSEKARRLLAAEYLNDMSSPFADGYTRDRILKAGMGGLTNEEQRALRAIDAALALAGECESCGGLNTSCPSGCERDPKTGELNG
jgi:hypothetical protein